LRATLQGAAPKETEEGQDIQLKEEEEED